MHEKPSSTPQPDKNPVEHSTAEHEPARSPAIYVASLADYNNGVLHGAWIEAAREPTDIMADIKAMLSQSHEPGAEEWAIHYYDDFGRAHVDEHESIERVARLAQGITEHGYAFSAWADLCEYDPERFDNFAETYLGHYDNVEDYVEQLADDLGYAEELEKVPEPLQPYVRFDTAALARDMELSGDINAVLDPAGGVWIFRSDV